MFKALKQILITMLVSLGLSGMVMAGTVGGYINTSGKNKFTVGAETDQVLSRDIKVTGWNDKIDVQEYTYTSGTTTWSFDADSMEYTKNDYAFEVGEGASSRILAVLNYGVLGNWDLNVKLGAADAAYEWKEQYNGLTYWDTESGDCDYGTAWAIGTRVKLFEADNGLKLGLSGQYFQAKLELSNVYWTDGYDGTKKDVREWSETPVSRPSFSTNEVEIKETQLAFFAAKTFNKITPYVGVKYSDLTADVKYSYSRSGYNVSTSTTTTAYLPFTRSVSAGLEADKNFGVFVGADFDFTQNLSLNLEARLVDEQAVSLGLGWKF